MGVYPVAVGSHQIFINTRPNLERGTFMPRPKAVIVVGLGEEGKLRAADLAQSVRQAVIAWAQRLAENKKHAPAVFELAATLLGSGGTGVTRRRRRPPRRPGRVRGQRSSCRTTHGSDGKWPRVSHLHFIELYLDRATEAWRALRMQAAATPGRYVIDDAVKPGTGPLQRPPDSGYRGAEFDFITVEAKPDKDGAPMISYTLDTRRARSEVRGQRAQSELLTRARGDRVERSESRPADRPHAVQPAGPRRARAVPGRQRRDADRARSADREDSVGAARHEERVATADAAVGDPRQAAPQAAHRASSASASPTPTPTPARW